jgi:hypothetical protein
MSHQVQLSPAASHRPTAVLDPAGHAAEPPACRSRCPYFPGRACAGYCPTLEIRSARPSFTPPPRFPADPGTGTAGPVRAVPPRSAGRPDSREEGSGARTPRATGAPLHAGPSAQRPASKTHDRARPAGYPAGTCHRPPADLHPPAGAQTNPTTLSPLIFSRGLRGRCRRPAPRSGAVTVSGAGRQCRQGQGPGSRPDLRIG